MEQTEDEITDLIKLSIEKCLWIKQNFGESEPINVLENNLRFLLAIENGNVEPGKDFLPYLTNLRLGYFAVGEIVFYDPDFMLLLCKLDDYVRFKLLNEPTYF